MATPNSTLIITDIVSTLGAIAISGGYKTDVQEVTRYGQTPDEATKRPSLDVHRGAVDYSVFHGNQLRCTMTVTVLGHIYAATETTREAAVENLLDDCIAALMSDPTRGGNAIDTMMVRSEDNVSDLPTLRNSQGLGSDFALQVRVRWDRETGSS